MFATKPLCDLADIIPALARHDDQELCVALFDRAHDVLLEVDRQSDLDQDWFWRLANKYSVGAGLS